MTCTACRATGKGDKLSSNRGWKQAPEGALCGPCLNQRYLIRAVTFPIAGPVDGTWEELRAALKVAWSASTRAANFVVTELAKAEEPRLPHIAKMPKAPRPYLYPGVRAIVPEMDTQSVTALLRSVEANYRAKRYETHWTGAAALRTYKYPVPYPVHNQAWSASLGDNGQALVSVRLGGQRWSLRLRGGHQFRRQLRAHKLIATGKAIRCELAFYRRRASDGDHRPETQRRPKFATMIKLVAWLPRSADTEAAGVLRVRTDADVFMVAEQEGREPWTLNGDRVRGWSSEGARLRRRMAEDLKFEKRHPKATRLRMIERSQARGAKLKRRLDSWTHETARMIVELARRRRVRVVEYNDTERGFCESFPWHRLSGSEKSEGLIEQKLREHGILFAHVVKASGDVNEESPEALAEEQIS